MKTQSYELSIWEDVLTTVNGKNIYSERQVAIISSDTMESLLKAYDVTISEKINGEKTLTFSILAKYFNKEINLLEDNPFFKLISNETKIKLRDGVQYDLGLNSISTSSFIQGDISSVLQAAGEEDTERRWTDFIVKTVNISTSNYVATITAKEIYVNELGKNGWSLLLDTEKLNNIGTLKSLASSILSLSDWQVDDNSTSVIEGKEFPILSATLSTSISIKNLFSDTTILVGIGNKIYFFYDDAEWDNTHWATKEYNKLLLILFFGNGKTALDYLDDDRKIINDDYQFNYLFTPIEIYGLVLDGYSGKKVLRNLKTCVEPVLDRAVKLYTATLAQSSYVSVGDLVYGYQDTEYISPANINSYLSNSTLFDSTAGWKYSYFDGTELKVKDITDSIMLLYPNYSSVLNNYFKYLRFNFSALNSNRFLLNVGPKYTNLNATIDKKFVVRLKARWIKHDESTGLYKEILDLNTALLAFKINMALIAKSKINASDDDWINATLITNSGIFSWKHSESYISDTDYNTRGYAELSYDSHKIPTYDENYRTDENRYFYTVLTVTTPRNYNDYDIGFKLWANSTGSYGAEVYDLCIEDILLFDCVTYGDNDDNIIFIDNNTLSTVKNKNVFYIIDDNNLVLYLSENEEKYTPVYADSQEGVSPYESMRTINIKESNYFNALLSLAELFDVWISFYVKHRKDGKLLLDENGYPQKMVKFSRYSPGYETNSLGFKYGINLKSIQRNDDSNAVASKLIVKYNSQEYADDGMCTIAKAKSNPSGETEIYNFDYYISKGMLNYTEVLKDLYGLSSSGSDLAYYPTLKSINLLLLSALEESLLSDEVLDIWNAKLSLYANQVSATEDEIELLTQDLLTYTDEQKRKEICNDINSLNVNLSTYRLLKLTAEKNIKEEEAKAIGQLWEEYSLNTSISNETIPSGAHAFELETIKATTINNLVVLVRSIVTTVSNELRSILIPTNLLTAYPLLAALGMYDEYDFNRLVYISRVVGGTVRENPIEVNISRFLNNVNFVIEVLPGLTLTYVTTPTNAAVVSKRSYAIKLSEVLL